MPLTEIREHELIELTDKSTGKEAVLFYTAFCGTCKVAERMLEVVEAAGAAVPVRKVNINFAPQLRDSWKITSVPCLVLLEDGAPVHFEYAMQSVGHLFQLLKKDDPGVG
jgi:thioredoxin-like negative regulator of GroEL